MAEKNMNTDSLKKQLDQNKKNTYKLLGTAQMALLTSGQVLRVVKLVLDIQKIDPYGEAAIYALRIGEVMLAAEHIALKIQC